MAVKIKLKSTGDEKLPRPGQVRRNGKPGYNARGSAQNQVKREAKMDKFSNNYGAKGSDKRKAYEKETNSEYSPETKKEAKVYNRLGAKRKRKITRREGKANKKSDS